MIGTLKKRLPKLQFSQILALPKDDDFILNLNNNLIGEMDPYKFEELERYFVAILNRLYGVEIEKHNHFGNGGHYSAPNKSPHDKVEPAFCKTVHRNVVYELAMNLLITASSRNYRAFKGYKWPFKIYGCGAGPNKYIPEIYVGSRILHIYTLHSQGDMVYEVEIVVFLLLHFARLPIAKPKYFSTQVSVFQLSTVKKTYERLFNTFLNMFLPDMLKNKKRKEGSRKGPPFVQVFGDLWFAPSFSDSPIIHRIVLLPLMKALVRRVVITQAFYQWEWQNVGTRARCDESSSRTCLSYESQSLQRPLFEFLFQAFTQWPLDTVQHIEAVVDMWIQFITPWKIEQKRQASMTSVEFQTVWGQWIAENLPFYSTLLKEFLRLSVNLDFRPLWARKMLIKVLKTFDERLIELMKENELTVIKGTCGYNNSQSEFWTQAVKEILEHCYQPDQGNHGLAFHHPHPLVVDSSQSFSYLGNRPMKSAKSVILDCNCPCFKIANTLMNNILEFKAQAHQPTSMSLSESLWTRIFSDASPVKPVLWGKGNADSEHDTCVQELVRLFKLELRSPLLRQPCSGGMNFCEVDQDGYLTELGRQQLISGERIINPQNVQFLRLKDVWGTPPMDFEIVFLLQMMKNLEFALLKMIGAQERSRKKHFLYGIGRRFASTSAVFWYFICSCIVYYLNPTLLISSVTVFSLVGLLTQFYPMELSR